MAYETASKILKSYRLILKVLILKSLGPISFGLLFVSCADSRPNYGGQEIVFESLRAENEIDSLDITNPNYEILDSLDDGLVLQAGHLETEAHIFKSSSSAAQLKVRYVFTNARNGSFEEIDLLSLSEEDVPSGWRIEVKFNEEPLDTFSGGNGSGQVEGTGDIEINVSFNYARMSDSGRLIFEVFENNNTDEQGESSEAKPDFVIQQKTEVLAIGNHFAPPVIQNFPNSESSVVLGSFSPGDVNRDIVRLDLRGRDVEFFGATAIRQRNTRWFFTPVNEQGLPGATLLISDENGEIDSDRVLSQLLVDGDQREVFNAFVANDSNLSGSLSDSLSDWLEVDHSFLGILNTVSPLTPFGQGDQVLHSLRFRRVIPGLRGNFHCEIETTIPDSERLSNIESLEFSNRLVFLNPNMGVGGFEDVGTSSPRFRVEVD